MFFTHAIRQHALVTFAIAASILLVGIAWLWAYVALHAIEQPLILHFTNAGGINQVGSFRDLSSVPIFGLIVVAVNGVIAWSLDGRDWFLGKFLAAGTLFVSILLFIAFAAIIAVN
jgi:hypothetical protein